MPHKNKMALYFSPNSILYNTFIISVSILFSFFIAFLPVDSLVDRANYLIYAEQSDTILNRYLSSGIGAFIFNEPLWLFINTWLSKFLSPEQTLTLIIFISSVFTFYLTLYNNKRYFLLAIAILLLPQVLKNNLIHIRQGLAIAIFLIGWFSGKHSLRFLCIGASCLIHSSFMFIFLIYFLSYFFEKFKFSFEIKALVFLAAGIAIGTGGIWLAGNLGARQGADYAEVSTEISGLGFILWLAILLIFLMAGKNFIKKHTFEVAIIILYLSTYFFLPVTARVLESALIPILLSAAFLRHKEKLIFFFIFTFYFLIQWYVKFSTPGLGWFIY